MSENKLNDGGPVYPVVTPGLVYGDGSYESASIHHQGLSLRDYFIAHAPAEPQTWFEPVMNSEMPKARWVSADDTQEFSDAGAAYEACGEDGFYDANYRLREEWRNEREKQRYVQWPAAWADEMLKARQKPRVEGV